MIFLEADVIDVLWGVSMKSDFNDDDFEECNENDMPSAVHELCRQHGAFNNIDFYLLVIMIFLLMKVLQ